MNKEFMLEAIALAFDGMKKGCGGPFGAVIVKDGQIIGRGHNQVTKTFDPTAHAEVVAIRDACQNIGNFSLEDCEVYTSCEPCPMCLAAIYWARCKKIHYACTQKDAENIGFDDSFFYNELSKEPFERHIPVSQLMREEALKAFVYWEEKADKIPY